MSILENGVTTAEQSRSKARNIAKKVSSRVMSIFSSRRAEDKKQGDLDTPEESAEAIPVFSMAKFFPHIDDVESL